MNFKNYIEKETAILTEAGQTINDLINNYRKVFPYSDHCKCCLLDAVKMNDDLGSNLIIGAIHVNEKEGIYTFYTAKTHMAYFEGETERYIEDQQRRIKELFTRLESNDVKQAIVESYIGESKHWDDVWAMDI